MVIAPCQGLKGSLIREEITKMKIWKGIVSTVDIGIISIQQKTSSTAQIKLYLLNINFQYRSDKAILTKY